MASTTLSGRTSPWILASGLSLISSMTLASSFQILEQSPALMGQGFAGTASTAEDATSVFFNPAALNQIDRSASVGLNAIFTEAQFRDEGSNTGGIEAKTDEIGKVPNLYAVLPWREGVTFGLGVNAPFGLASEYDKDWIGRYIGTYSDLQIVNVTGAVALQLNPDWALGVSLIYQRAEVTLESQIDSTLGLNPTPTLDSSAHIAGKDDTITTSLALFYAPSDDTKLGLVWHRGGHYDLQGHARFNKSDMCQPGAGYATGTPPAPTTGSICSATLDALGGKVTAPLELPDTVTLSASQRVNERVWVHADVAWTQWSDIKKIDVINQTNLRNVSSLDLQYENSMRYALGASYQVNPAWKLRAGVAFDETAQNDPTHVTPRVPDEDRTWLTLGVSYAASNRLSFDLSYAYLHVESPSIHNLDTNTGHKVEGTFTPKVNILGLQTNWRF